MEKEGGVIFKQGVSGVDRFSSQNGTRWFDTGTTNELFQLIRTSFSWFSFMNQSLFFGGVIRFQSFAGKFSVLVSP